MSTAIEKSSLAKRIDRSGLGPEVVRKMREGETPLAIAQWLQEDLMEFTEANRGELELAIKEHIKDTVPLEERLILFGQDRGAIARTVAKQKEATSAFERMEKLLHLQMGRLELLHNLEDASGITMGNGGNEVEIARRMIMNLHEIEQDVGSTRRSSPQGGITPEMKMKLGKALKKLIDDADDDVIDVEVKPIDEADDGAEQAEGPVSDGVSDSA